MFMYTTRYHIKFNLLLNIVILVKIITFSWVTTRVVNLIISYSIKVKAISPLLNRSLCSSSNISFYFQYKNLNFSST